MFRFPLLTACKSPLVIRIGPTNTRDGRLQTSSFGQIRSVAPAGILMELYDNWRTLFASISDDCFSCVNCISHRHNEGVVRFISTLIGFWTNMTSTSSCSHDESVQQVLKNVKIHKIMSFHVFISQIFPGDKRDKLETLNYMSSLQKIIPSGENERSSTSKVSSFHLTRWNGTFCFIQLML